MRPPGDTERPAGGHVPGAAGAGPSRPSVAEAGGTTPPVESPAVTAQEDPPADACAECLRDTWALGAVSARLEYHTRDPTRLLELLALPGEQLVRALAGRWRESLLERHARFDPAETPPVEGVQRTCRHRPHCPVALAQAAAAPRIVHVAGGLARLEALLAAPTVAIVGTHRASDYGMEVAHGLARGLAASGLTVVSGLAEGIPAAAHLGALEAGGRTVTVTAGGVDVPHPPSWRGLHRRIAAEGCAIAELPCGSPPRRWSALARARTVAALAGMVIVVEAGERPAELLHARLAAAAGTLVAAVPGRVWSPGAHGPHELLREGAVLVRGPQDVLDALYGGDPRPCAPGPTVGPHARMVFEQVGDGHDTVAKLLARGARAPQVLRTLAELECSGAVVRGDSGRYLPALGAC